MSATPLDLGIADFAFNSRYVLRREVGEQERLYHWESSTASADDRDVALEKAENVKSDYTQRDLSA